MIDAGSLIESPLDTVQFGPLTDWSVDRLGCWGDTRDDSAEIFVQSVLEEAVLAWAGMSAL